MKLNQRLTATVHCFCGRLVMTWVRRRRRGLLRAFGAVCDCGRGIDLYIETQPANDVQRAGSEVA